MKVIDLEASIEKFGTTIFKLIGQEQPSAFKLNGLNGRLMMWSMTKPKLKVNMFRLVDVLPTLKSSSSITDHARQYLEEPVKEINPILSRALTLSGGRVSSLLASRMVKFAVHQMAKQFIAGKDPSSALKALRKIRKEGMAFTVDLLGEFAVSEQESLIYQKRYLEALDTLHNDSNNWQKSSFPKHPGETSAVCISVKLTALYSQCSPLNFERSVNILSERLIEIISRAKKYGALVYIDAEDSANNPIIYQVFKNVFMKAEFRDFPYPGIVLQAYAQKSEATLLDLINYAKMRGAPIAVRLVKGAYWDQETISAQQQHWPSPLFAHKESTDHNYERLSKILIDNYEHCLPAFGSHNVRSLSYACCYAESKGLNPQNFELQMLYGMAEPIARAFKQKGYLVRYYVPLGEILPGMGYLVRRLLENTSNESFLRHTFYDAANISSLLQKPGMIDNIDYE
jgi:proline dehydrogenase